MVWPSLCYAMHLILQLNIKFACYSLKWQQSSVCIRQNNQQQQQQQQQKPKYNAYQRAINRLHSCFDRSSLVVAVVVRAAVLIVAISCFLRGLSLSFTRSSRSSSHFETIRGQLLFSHCYSICARYSENNTSKLTIF